MLDRKTLILQLFCSVMCNDFWGVGTEISDVSADVGVHLQAVQTLLTMIEIVLPVRNVVST